MAGSVLRDLAPVLLKLGGVLLLVLGVADILKGFAAIIVFSIIGWVASSFLASIFPALTPLSGLLPLLGPVVGGASLIIGAAAVVIGYQLMKLATPIPAPTRDRWLVIAAVLAAVALVFLSPWYLLALATIIAGLLLSPTAQPPLPPQP
ncbi:MAG: hypothetical protein QXF69_08525 [Thermofilaceae archaeon]